MGVRVRCQNESPIITVGFKNVAATKKSMPSAFTRQGNADGIFFILRVLFTMSFYHKAGQSIRSIIWKLCNVFVRQSGKKDLMCGRRIDGCSNMTMRPHIHRSFIRDFLAKHAMNVLPQPPYSPDLAPANFFPFPKLKSTLKGCHFASIEAIKTNSLAHLRSIPKTAFQECFRTLKKRWQRCRVDGSTLKATRLNSFKVRMEHFYAIYSGIFRTDLVYLSSMHLHQWLVLYISNMFAVN